MKDVNQGGTTDNMPRPCVCREGLFLPLMYSEFSKFVQMKGGNIMGKHVISILVDNTFGVLTRISGLFSRRGYNIDSLSVGITEDPKISRMTILVDGDDYVVDQIQRQLSKLIDVLDVRQCKQDRSVYRELALVKVKANLEDRSHIVQIVEIFRASIVDVCNETIMVEITGDEGKIEAFLNLVQPFGIEEVVRTGVIALQRANISVKEAINSKKSEEEE